MYLCFFKQSSPVPVSLQSSSCGLHINKILRRIFTKVQGQALAKPMCSCFSKLLSLADSEHCFTEAADDWGYNNFCGGHVLDEDSGFVKEGNLLFGVHISVTSPVKVPMELSYAQSHLCIQLTRLHAPVLKQGRQVLAAEPHHT